MLSLVTELRSSDGSLTRVSHSGRRTPRRRLAAYPAVNSPDDRCQHDERLLERRSRRPGWREQPHWYLAFIGVDPARQEYGVGAALLRSRLRRCDEEGLPAYLESSKLENVPPYQHFGFHVTGTLTLPEGAPVVNTMWRPGVSSVQSGLSVSRARERGVRRAVARRLGLAGAAGGARRR